MARGGVTKKKAAAAEPLQIGLADPGLTPMLRAGLGGLAASIRAHALETEQPWPGPVSVGPGTVHVEPRSVQIEWGDAAPQETLEALFAASFRVAPPGVIDLPGTYDRGLPPRPALAAALQDGLKRTFLQHGKTTGKDGTAQSLTYEIDEVPATFSFQPYAWFVHQRAFAEVEKARMSGSVTLAGWANPGAVARHIAVKATDLRYDAQRALCACFAIVGCLSLQVPRVTGGALIIPEPTDLVRFARTRPKLTPRTLPDAYIAGPSDGVLAVQIALQIEDAAGHHGVGRVHGVQLKALPWAKQQKSRFALVSSDLFSGEELDRYHQIQQTLPNRLRVRKADGVVFGVTSALRGFLTDNLASRAPWFQGFATATDGGSDGRRVHYYREPDNLGALYREEQEGLIKMVDQLEGAELVLVRAVHAALRSRFAAIAKETNDAPLATRRKRWDGERDRWRHAFSGSKTPEQIRAALADLWSRAGRNDVLAEQWEQVLPLLRPAHWTTARDLALVALASYRSATKEEAAIEDEPAVGDDE